MIGHGLNNSHFHFSPSAIPNSFTAYIGESGDQGIVFRENPQLGSSRMFVLSAVVVRREFDSATVPLARAIGNGMGIGEKDVIPSPVE